MGHYPSWNNNPWIFSEFFGKWKLVDYHFLDCMGFWPKMYGKIAIFSCENLVRISRFWLFRVAVLRLTSSENAQWIVWALMDPKNPLVLSVTWVSKLNKYAFLAQNHEFKVTMLSMVTLRFRQFFQAVLRFFQKFCAVLRFSRPLWHPPPHV